MKTRHSAGALSRRALVIAALLPWLSPSAGAISNLGISRDAGTGAAVLQWNESSAATSFDIDRQADNGSTSCAGGELLTSDGWCRQTVTASVPAAGQRTFTDSHVVLDPAMLTEYRYRVNYSGVSENAASGWAPNCPTPTGAFDNWIEKLNLYANLPTDGSGLDADSLKTLLAPNGGTRYNDVPVGTDHYYFLSNDRYIAAFNKSGALIGITHRLYGMQFMEKPQTSDAVYAFNYDADVAPYAEYGISIDKTVNPTPDFDATTGRLTFVTSNFGSSRLPGNAQVAITWSLPEGGRKGLHGRIAATNMEADTAAPKLKSIRFPLLNGLGNSGNDSPGVIWPMDNGGVYYPSWPTPSRAGDPTISGGLHNAGLQLQFFGVRLGGAQNNYWLYVGAEDPTFEPKAMTYKPFYYDNSHNKHLAPSYVEFYPRQADYTDGNGIAPQYDVVLTPMCASSWAPLAAHYRNWALGSVWNGSTLDYTLTATADKPIPENLQSGVFWWESYPGWDELQSESLRFITDTARDYKKIIGPITAANPGGSDDNIAIHQYRWHTDGYGNFPRFTPLAPVNDDDLLNAFTAIQSDGTMLAPYTQVVFADIADRFATPTTLVFPDSNGRSTHCLGSQSSASSTPSSLDKTQNHGWWNTTYGDGLYLKDYMIYNGPVDNTYGLTRMTGDTSNDRNIESDVAYYCFHQTDSPTEKETPLAYADPSSPFWSNIVTNNAMDVLMLNGAGVYLDSFGIGYRPDYSAKAGIPNRSEHGDGHGHWWLQGFRYIGAMIMSGTNAVEEAFADDPRFQKYPGKRRFVAGEFFNEGLLPYFDAILNYTTPQPFSAPIVQAVYADYFVSAGPALNSGNTDSQRALLLGRNFVWGYQLGLVEPGNLCGPSYPTCFTDSGKTTRAPLAAYASKLTHAHVAWNDYLQFGQYMGSADPDDASTASFCHSQNTSDCETVPAIRGALWEGSSGRAIVLTNTTSSSQTASIPVPMSWRKSIAYICTLDNSCTMQTMTSSTATISVTLAGLDVQIIVLNK